MKNTCRNLLAAALLAMAAVAIAAPKHVQAQTASSMLLTGMIEIEADGSVRGYSIDNEARCPTPCWRASEVAGFPPVMQIGACRKIVAEAAPTPAVPAPGSPASRRVTRTFP